MKKIFVLILTFALTICSLGALTSCGGARFDENKNISVVVREDGSGTKSAFMELVCGDKSKTDISGVIVATGTSAVAQEIQSNPHAIAYESLGFATKYDVKILTVDGVEPTVENIKNGSYAIARPLNVVYQESRINNSATNSAYLAFLQSSDAQTIIANEGFVSTRESATAYVVTPGLSGEVNISGSTSLEPLMIKLAAKFEELQPDVNVTVAGGGSGTGYNNAENGVSDFGMISEEFNSAKAESCTYYEVALDGIAVIVNNANVLENISLEDLRRIYDKDAGENAIKVWADVAK